MARKPRNEYEERHDGELSRRRLFGYLIGGGALAAGVYYGLPVLLERSPNAARRMEKWCNEVMRQNNDLDAVENIQERIVRLKRELEERVEDAKPIKTFEEFDKIRENLEGNYKLVNDIHCHKGHNWEPIGSYEKPFIGTFNGQGHTVYDLRAEWPERDYVGMFGVVGRHKVTCQGDRYVYSIGNLKLEKIKIKGNAYCGKIVGSNLNGLIHDCYASGEVHGIGIVGGNIGGNGGILLRLSNDGSIDGNFDVGGEIGFNNGGYVINCVPNDYVKEDKIRHKGSLIGQNMNTFSLFDDYSEHIPSKGTIGLDNSPKEK